jgi:hypothetical protein
MSHKPYAPRRAGSDRLAARWVAHDIGAPEADYIVQAANAYPGQAEEVARLRERVALLDSLLGECLRHHYYDDDQVSQSWLVEARKAVTSTTGRPRPIT